MNDCLEYDKYDPFTILTKNGWKWLHYTDATGRRDWRDGYCFEAEQDTGDQYVLTLLDRGYETTVRAVVSCRPKHLELDGHYGVLWVDAVEYESDPPYSVEDLEDMISAIELAEENLLRIGMPFTDGRSFHGSKAEIEAKIQRNNELRERYKLDEKERADDKDV